MDGPSREVHVGGRRINVRLSKKEFDLLLYLFGKAGETCSREELSDTLWGSVEVGGQVVPRYDDNMLHALVHRLRGKLARAGLDLGRYLTSVAGVGYRLDASPHEATEPPSQEAEGGRGGISWAVPAAGAGGLLVGFILLGIILLVGGDPDDSDPAVITESPTPDPAVELCGSEMISPMPGGVLPGSTVTFTWTPGCGMTKYDLWVGCSPGAVDFFNAEDGNFLEATVPGLPQDGGPVFVLLTSSNSTEEGTFTQRYEFVTTDLEDGGVILVPGTAPWTDTGIDVAPGQSIEIEVCGQVTVSSAGAPTLKADGDVACPGAYQFGFPAPDLPCWALIGRMDDGEPFLVGPSFQTTPGAQTGRLYLGVNDDNVTDNSGAFRATIRLAGP